ncbi:MAG: sugar transferase [Actinomycetota bacterium]|nr:sugar transferase [Actinomycetota bacterium]
MFDIISSLIVLIIISPLLLAIALLIKLSDKGPIFFSQRRIGQSFKPFNLLKFRTMVVNADKMGPSITSKDDPRITKMGRLLRKAKLDEFPQLLNVLKGDMSLVGPRPEVERYVRIFRNDYEDILKVKPGITDYAAIEFRDEEAVLRRYDNPEEAYVNEVLPKKISFYKKYICEVSFFTDIKLIFITFNKVITGVAERTASGSNIHSS